MQFKGKIKVLGENDRVLVDVQNTITELFEEVVACGGIDSIYSACNPIEMGASFLQSKSPYTDSNGSRNSYFQNELLTVYFLNLTSAEKAALTNGSNTLPIYTSDFKIDDDKIVGYAYAINSASMPKQGYSDELTGITLIDPRRHGQKFKWDAGVLSGSYNCIAVGLNAMVGRIPGVACYRGLDNMNAVIGQTISAGKMIRPGVHNADSSVIITSDTQILVGDSTNVDKGRRLIDLVTGEITMLSAGDAAYDFPLQRAKYNQMVIGDYLVFEDVDTMKRIDIATKAITSLGTGNGGFMYNDFLYYRSDYYNTTTKKVNTSTWSSSTGDLNLSNMHVPDILMSTNSGFKFTITQLDATHYLGTCFNTSTPTSPDFTNGHKIGAVIFTDINDIEGSIVKLLPNLDSAHGCKINGKYYFFSDYILNSDAQSRRYSYKNTGGSQVTIDKHGVKFTREDIVGNMFSFHTFEQDQQIPTGEAIKLEYYYTFDQ